MAISSIQTSPSQTSTRQDNVSDNEEISTATNYCFSEKYDKPIMVFQWLALAVFIMVACRVGDGNEVTSNRSADYFLMAAMALLTVSPFVYLCVAPKCTKQSSALQEIQIVCGAEANVCYPTTISSVSESGNLTVYETSV